MGIIEQAEEALAAVERLSASDAVARIEDDSLMFVDVRDIREVEQSDTIAGSRHAPRGMIEFWFDPDSPYHREIYADPDRTYVLFCPEPCTISMSWGNTVTQSWAGSDTIWTRAPESVV